MRKERNSSVEIFRIIATFLVLIVHFNGWFVGMPEKFIGIFTPFTIGQTLIESLSCTCVNCFLIITGWYGLRIKWKHIWTIYSIVVFIYVPFYVVTAIYTHDFSIKRLIWEFFAIGKESYYVQSYLMLLFLSPILNSFVKKFGKSITPYILCFWGVEFFLDCICKNKCLGFGNGYELTHFVFMYLLGQCAFLNRNKLLSFTNIGRNIVIYIGGMFIISLMYFASVSWSFAYTNPLNIIMGFSLFLIFEKRTFHSRAINWISKSTLAVYIAHCTSPLCNMLRKLDNYILGNYSYGMYLFIISGIIVATFCFGILYDKIRILIMEPIGNGVCKKLDKLTENLNLKEING